MMDKDTAKKIVHALSNPDRQLLRDALEPKKSGILDEEWVLVDASGTGWLPGNVVNQNNELIHSDACHYWDREIAALPDIARALKAIVNSASGPALGPTYRGMLVPCENVRAGRIVLKKAGIE